MIENGTVEGGFDVVVGAEVPWSRHRGLMMPVQLFFSGVGGHKPRHICRYGELFSVSTR